MSVRMDDGYAGHAATIFFPCLAAFLVHASSYLSSGWILMAIGTYLALVLAHDILSCFCGSFMDFWMLLSKSICASLQATYAYVYRGCEPKFPGWTFAYESFQAVAVAVGEPNGIHLAKRRNDEAMRRVLARASYLHNPLSCWQHGMQQEEVEFNDLKHIWLRPKRVDTSARQIVLVYYHGGGYALLAPPTFVNYCCRLAYAVHASLASVGLGERVQCQVLIANYRKVPTVCFPVPVDDAMKAIDYVGDRFDMKDVLVSGDSAGGGLALSVLLRLRDAKREMPLAGLSVCPYVDAVTVEPASEQCYITPAMLASVRNATMTKDSEWEEAVVLGKKFQGLPPLLIVGGEFDVLRRQSHLLVKQASADGVQVDHQEFRSMPHVFTALPPHILPASDLGMQCMGKFVARMVQRCPASAF